MHNAIDSIDMNSTRGDIGTDKNLKTLGPERLERLIALSLGPIAMDRTHVEPRHLEVLHESIYAAFGSTKDHHRFVHADNARRERDTLCWIGAPEKMGRRFTDRVFGTVYLIALGVVLISPDQLLDISIERCREKQRLPVRADLIEEFSHDRHEAHVCHAVSLIDDDDLDLVETKRTAIDEVGKSTRTRDSDVNATT